MSSTTRYYVNQLIREELVELAHSINLKIPENFGLSALRNILSRNVSTKDVEAIVKTPLKAKTKEGRGYERMFKAGAFEKRVASIFKRQGFECETNVRIKGAEFDIIGKKKGRRLKDDEWIFVECKNKSKVAPFDFKKFLGNFKIFKETKGIKDDNITGYLYTTGLWMKDVGTQARKISNVKLKRMPIVRIKNR